MKKIVHFFLFCLLIGTPILIPLTSRADYKQDEETRRAAEKFDQLNESERQAAMKEYDKEHPDGSDSAGLGTYIAVIVVVVVGITFFFGIFSGK